MQASDPLDPRGVLGSVKAQPGNAEASRKPSATAGLTAPAPDASPQVVIAALLKNWLSHTDQRNGAIIRS
jgi:hypothetical protein